MYGRLFFDYNGNGMQDGKEPAIPKAKVKLVDNTGKVTAEAVTDSSGDYKLEDVSTGAYRLYVEADKKFRYMCRTIEEFRAVEEGYDVLLNESGQLNIGLMEGFLTMPFANGTKEYGRRVYVNIGPDGKPTDWRGGKQTYQRLTYKHAGIDYFIREGTPILAAAPGSVSGHSYDPHGGRVIWLEHKYGYYTLYSHLKEVIKDTGTTKRGEVIGLSGSSMNDSAHLHFEVEKPPYPRSQPFLFPVDPYRSLVPRLGSPLSLWSKDNDPQYPF